MRGSSATLLRYLFQKWCNAILVRILKRYPCFYRLCGTLSRVETPDSVRHCESVEGLDPLLKLGPWGVAFLEADAVWVPPSPDPIAAFCLPLLSPTSPSSSLVRLEFPLEAAGPMLHP
ncbi:hypothetical protein PHSY_006689 [Pseudozyma hubeiensis SY62]|uniref:Uncharacterized protein n=1 Tax=Pseudozyma hubeiensis (strain SY62) TaxID=1305764 RepID=R9PCW6_PSEHS|nr:hypothetical protein PHSY_006689 [Pseudozyma hubeiensis SY62]GAC99092.1 hypothetical protein PHSY_006689 [Pseudozyma hubeiensis SY62]